MTSSTHLVTVRPRHLVQGSVLVVSGMTGLCVQTLDLYPLHIFSVFLIDASYRYNLLEGGSCSVHYYGRLGAVSVVCVWAGVGEALR